MTLPFFRVRLSPWSITGMKLAALFLLIVGAKLCLLRTCSTPLPFFDQWYGEGTHLIQRSLHGTLSWGDLFVTHNQHRILWTRLLVLGLFHLNGQWDTQVEMIAAAGVHALCAVALGAILIRRLGVEQEDRILVCLSFLFMLPFGWENTLSGGFQSQYYFLILFSLLAIWGLAAHRPWCLPWFVGLVAGALAWFSVASGWFAGLMIAAWAAFRWWQDREDAQDHIATLAAGVLLTVGGLCLLFGMEPVGDTNNARSLGEFVWKFFGLLAWPNQTPWLLLFAYAPIGWLLWSFLRGHRTIGEGLEDFVLPLGGWVVLQTAALAYARNHYRGLDVSRYMDVQSLGVLANFASLLVLARHVRVAGHARVVLRALMIVWVALTAFGLHRLTERNLQVELPIITKNNSLEERVVAGFVTGSDPQPIATRRWSDLQCDDLKGAGDLLNDPLVRAVLPTRVLPPLPLVPALVAGTVQGTQALEGFAPGEKRLGWRLSAPTAGVPSSVFRSETMQANLPRLQFPVVGTVGPDAEIGLVGEHSGQITPLLPDAETDGLWTANVPNPDEPFHLVAKVEAGNRRGLEFFEPKGIGRLSSWVAPLFNAATGFLFAGALLWIAAAVSRKTQVLDMGTPADGETGTPVGPRPHSATAFVSV